MSVRLLLVGVGGYGGNYLDEVLDRRDDSRFIVAGICDPMVSRSPRFVDIQKAGYPLYSDFSQALEESHAALVVIASPIHTHYGYLKTALEHDVPCLTEKPVTMSLPEMDELVALSQERKVPVAVGFQMCYRPDMQAIKRDILAGVYGKLVSMKVLRMMRRGMNYYGRASWAGKIMMGTEPVFDSPLTNACAHEFENMVFLAGKEMRKTGEVHDVDARLFKANPHIENFDAIALSAVTTDGIPLHFYSAHCLGQKKVGPFCEYRCAQAVVRQQGDSFAAYGNDGSPLRDYRVEGEGNRLEKLYAALRMAETGEEPACTLLMAREHVAIVNEVQKLPIQNIAVNPQTIDDEVCYPIVGIEEKFTSLYEKALIEEGS